MNRILVTGSNGQLGRELQRALGENPNLIGEFHDIDTLDITNVTEVEKLLQSKSYQFVINCAAYTAVDKAESEPDKAHLINAEAVRILAEATRKTNIRFIHVSTDYVFDGKNYKPYVETDTVNPQSVYGSTKLEGEKAAMLNPDTMVIRTAWLYSVHGNNFVKTMMRLGAERKQLYVVFDQVGSPTNARDLANAIATVVDQSVKDASAFIPGVYHFTNEGTCSWFDFAHDIMQLAHLDCVVLPIEAKDYPAAAARPHYSVLNKTKIKTNYQLTIPHWRDSLVDCIHELTK
jgi:dTDP-4-dehydrorhamnose reductase